MTSSYTELWCLQQEMLLPARRKGRNNKGGDRRNEMTMQERYQDVKDFWLKQAPHPSEGAAQSSHPAAVARLSQHLQATVLCCAILICYVGMVFELA